jgi:hypothetical protein
MREENTHFSCRICEKWAVQPCALHTYDKDTREIGSRVEPEDPSRLAPGVEVAGVVAVGDTVVSLADVAEAGNIVEPSSTADVFTGVVGASREDSEEVLETGVVVMRNGSGVNIVGLMRTNLPSSPSLAILPPVVGGAQKSILDDHGSRSRCGQREAISPALISALWVATLVISASSRWCIVKDCTYVVVDLRIVNVSSGAMVDQVDVETEPDVRLLSSLSRLGRMTSC